MNTNKDQKQIVRDIGIAVVTAAVTGAVTNLVFQDHSLRDQKLIDLAVVVVVLLGTFFFLALRRGNNSEDLIDDKRNIVREIKEKWLPESPAGTEDVSALKPFPVTVTAHDWHDEPLDLPEEVLLNSYQYRMTIQCDQNSGQAFFLRRIKQLVKEYEANEEKKRVPLVLLADTWFKTDDFLYLDSKKPGDKVQKANAQADFPEWVTRQLKSQYGISHERAHALIKNKQFIYCIEGIERVGRYHESADLNVRSTVNPTGHGDYTTVIQTLFQEMLLKYDAEKNNEAPFLIITTILPQNEGWSFDLEEGHCKVDVKYPSQTALQQWLVENGPALAKLKDYFAKNEMDGIYAADYRATLEMIAGRCLTALPDAVIRGQKNLNELRHAIYLHHFKDVMEQIEKYWNRAIEKHPYRTAELRKRQYVRAFIQEQNLPHIIEAAQTAIQWLSDDAVFRIDEIQPQTSPQKETVGVYQKRLAFLLTTFITLAAGLPSAVGVWYGWFSRGHALHGLFSGLGTFTAILAGGVIAGVSYTRNLNKAVVEKPESGAKGSPGFFRTHRQMLARAAWIGLGFGLGRGAAVGLAATTYSYSTPYIGGIDQGLVSVIGAAFIFFSYFYFLDDDPLIILIKEKKEGIAPTRALLAVLLSLVVAVSVWKTGVKGGWERGLAFGLVLLAFNFAFFVRKNSVSPQRIRPNQGIREAFRISRNLSVSLACFAAVVFSGLYRYGYHSPKEGVEVFFEAMSFLLTFFFLDGLSLMKHAALRYALEKTNQFPKYFEMTLEFAADMGLLTLVGSGYKYPNDDIKGFIMNFKHYSNKHRQGDQGR